MINAVLCFFGKMFQPLFNSQCFSDHANSLLLGGKWPHRKPFWKQNRTKLRRMLAQRTNKGKKLCSLLLILSKTKGSMNHVPPRRVRFTDRCGQQWFHQQPNTGSPNPGARMWAPGSAPDSALPPSGPYRLYSKDEVWHCKFFKATAAVKTQ